MAGRSIALLMLCLLTVSPALAQDPPANSMLDPKPYDPATDPNVTMFVGNWRDSMPRNIHGSLVVRDILTQNDGGDHLRPPRKAACLTELVSVSHATLEPGASTQQDKLSGIQELYYFVGGEGTLSSGGKTYEIHKGSSALVPPGITFSMAAAAGREPLAMYLIVEPIPEGFTPRKDVAVRFEFDRQQFISVHWANIDRAFIGKDDGTAVIGGLTGVKIDPMTMAQPHSHRVGVEEVWIALKGDLKLQMGKQFLDLPPGSAYRVPDNNITAHANVNFGDTQAKLIHMMRQLPGENHPYGQLDPKLYDPAVDPDIDMFMGDWRLSLPRNIHGCLVVRDILTAGNGNPLKPTRKGACLSDLVSVSYATLESQAFTEPTTLKDEQEIYYIQSGTGVLDCPNRTIDLRNGIGLIIPPGVEYTMRSTGDGHLTMYRIVEPVPPGFRARKDVLAHDEYESPLGNFSHWVYGGRSLFGRDDGLAVLAGIAPITIAGMSFGHPHSHGDGVEEVWIALEGKCGLLLGKQLRNLPVGAAYKIPPTGMTAHSNINTTDEPMKMMWMMKVAE